MIVGTVSYMSPEQARGRSVDHRSDQFSFGLLLYEMAAGRKAFDEPESVQTLAAIISDDPLPLDARLPAPLRWVIDRCLAKNPESRYDSSRDLFHELRSLRDHLSEISTQVEHQARCRLLHGRPARGAFLLRSCLAWSSRSPSPSPGWVHRFPIHPDTASRRSRSSLEGSTHRVFRGRQGCRLRRAGRRLPHRIRCTSDTWTSRQRCSSRSCARRRTRSYGAPTANACSSRRLGCSRDLVDCHHRRRAATRSLAAQVVGRNRPRRRDRVDRQQGRRIPRPTRTTQRGCVHRGTARRHSGEVLASSRYATKVVYNIPSLQFSPDGRQLLLLLNRGRDGEEGWLLKYPQEGVLRVSVASSRR